MSLFTVPAGTRSSPCRSCQKPCYWITTAKGKAMLVDCRPDAVRYPGCFMPTDQTDGTGISHFANCPNADKHRRAH